jgi:hypothetical protein
MKAKLIKLELNEGYRLDDEKGNLIASTLDGAKTKLSKQNCDEIFGVIDVEKLAMGYELYEKINFVGQTRAYIVGFNKAMELNKDKVFTLEDMKLMFEFGYRKNNLIETTFESALNFIQSIQQPTEIEVEIVMSPCYYDDSLGGFSTSYTEGKPIEEPKLDKDGCLILKRVL